MATLSPDGGSSFALHDAALTTNSGNKRANCAGTCKTKETAAIEASFWKIATSNEPEAESRRAFRKLLLDSTPATGVCHVVRDNEGDWDINPLDKTGRALSKNDFGDELAASCENAVMRQAIQIHQDTGLNDTQALLSPVVNLGLRPEILLIVLPTTADVGASLRMLERVSAAFRFWLKVKSSARNEWKLNSLAAMVELVSKIESCTSQTEACNVVVNELAQHMGCRVALGIKHQRKARLKAVSGKLKLNRNTRHSWAFQQVVNEVELREKEGIYPVENDDDSILLAHKQLVGRLQVESVRSRKMESTDGKVVGYLVFAGDRSVVCSNRMKKFLDAITPRVAGALHVVKRAERPLVVRMMHRSVQQLSKTKTLVGFGVVGALVLLMCWPMTYRVRCSCIVEPVDRRFAVAPFDGLVQRTLVKPGDLVKQEQVLAEMDGRAIRWELSGVVAEREQARKTHEIELSKRNVSKAILARYETERLEARQEILDFRHANLSIRSPIVGTVLGGSPEKNNAASVNTGDVLFEIAPVSPLKVEISIPADDIGHVQQGMDIEIWIDGFEGRPIQGVIDRIYPRSEIRDSKNVFIAEFVIPNESQKFRPGMKGFVRIDTDKHPLAWNLFHKPMNYVLSRWFSW